VACNSGGPMPDACCTLNSICEGTKTAWAKKSGL
jgi:hypothetical protein